MRHTFLTVAVPVLLTTGVGLRSFLGSQPVTPAGQSAGFQSRCGASLAGTGDARSSARLVALSSADSAASGGRVYLMGAAHLPGFNDTAWRTSLEVCNFGGMIELFQLAFLLRGQSNPAPATVDLTLEPGLCVQYPDVVADVFGLDEAAGTVRLESSGNGIVAMARTYNETPYGTYGYGIAATPADQAVTSGESAVLIHLAQSADDDSGFRANLDLLNVGDGPIAVEIALYSAGGILYDVLTRNLGAFEYDQIFRVFRQVIAEEVEHGYAVVRTITPGGAFLAGGSLIDNRTGDATAIEALRTPVAEGWLEPVNLGPTINSTWNDWYPVLARDGSFMIFVSDRPGGYGSSDLYISRRVEGVWQEPVNLGPNVNTSGMESAPYLSADDGVLFFASFAPGGVGSMDVWYCPLDDGVPGERVNPGEPINTPYLDCCPVISADGNTLYICSDRPGGYGSMDVWVAHRVGGVWQEPVNLGQEVNTYATDCPRWLSDDDDTLVVASTRHDGLGDADLWFLLRRGDGWSTPVNFGTPINSLRAEWGPGFLDNGGELAGTIFFGSGRTGGQGRWDIWYSAFGNPGVLASMSVPAVPGAGGSGVTAFRRAAGESHLPGTSHSAGSERRSVWAMIGGASRADMPGPAATAAAIDCGRAAAPDCPCMREAM